MDYKKILQLRTAEEVDRMHTLVESLMRDPSIVFADPTVKLMIGTMRDVLCWALLHPHPNFFADFIKRVLDARDAMQALKPSTPAGEPARQPLPPPSVWRLTRPGQGQPVIYPN